MIKTLLSYSGVAFICLLLQVAFLPTLFSSWPVPNLTLLFVLILAIIYPHESGYKDTEFDIPVLVALVAGLLMEMFAVGSHGVYIVGFVTLAWLLRLITQTWITPGVQLQTALLVLLAASIMMPLATMIVGGQFTLMYLILSVLVNSLIAIPSLFILYVRTGR